MKTRKAPRRECRPIPPARRAAVRRGLSMRMVGLVLSVLTALIAIVLVLIVMNQRPAPGQDEENLRPPDIKPIDLATAGRNVNDPTASYATGAMNWTSQNERGEAVQEFGWESLDPLEAGRFDVTNPKARFYLASGETVSVEAARARVHRPGTAQTPETGTFAGGVIVRIYESRIAADDPSVPPIAILETESIDFDFTIGRLATRERVFLTSRRVEFEGTGLDLLYNQVSQRIEKLTIERGQQLLYILEPLADPTAVSAGPLGYRHVVPQTDVRFLPAALRQPEEPAALDSETVDVPREDFYRIKFGGQVSVRQHTRVIHSDDLTALVQLLDGKLPLEDAPTITRRTPPTPRPLHQRGLASLPGHPAAILSALALGQVADDPTVPEEPAPAGRQSLLVPHEEENLLRINWAGPMSVRPMDEEPIELANDTAHIHFAGKPVQLRDEDAENEARCGSMEYFATQRIVTMHSSLLHQVTMRDRNGSVVEGPEFELSLDTGLGRLVGAGSALQGQGNEALGSAPAGMRLDWSDRLLVQFDVVGESLRDLREAICEGSVEVHHDDFHMKGDWLRLQLDSTGESEQLQPRRISAQGAVHGMVYGSGELRCDEVDAELEPHPVTGEAFPNRIEARGNVVGADDLGRTLLAARAEMLLEPAPDDAEDDEPRLARFLAWGEPGHLIQIDDGDGLTAEGLELLVEEEGAILTLRGEPALARRDGATVRGPELRIDDEADLLVIEGAGDLDYDAALAGAPRDRRAEPRRDRLQASWQEKLIYDGQAKVIRCLGEVRSMYEPSPTEVDLLDCDDLTIALADNATLDNAGASMESGLRRLDAEGNARMEHRRYLSPARQQLDRLLYIAGERLDYDNIAERLHVPTAGQLVVADERRYREVVTDNGTQESLTALDIGRATFTWQGEMTFEPNRGAFEMQRHVTMRHREQAESELFVLECQALTATTTPFVLAGGGGNAREAELLRVIAEQAVYAEYGDRMLIADRIDYDAPLHLLTASAVPGNTVMTVRSGDIAPQRMDLFRWNLETDKVEMEGIRPIRIPRGYAAPQ
jgi:hypothetical protein